MPETNSTILIPDISGYTEFMTSTELEHASHAINMLIDAMIEAIGEEYEVSEIEGDAVLLVRKGAPPLKKEIVNTCLRIFNAFHFRRKFMQQRTICPCGACQAIIDLSLKFVVHYGPLAEMKVGRFTKQSGVDMIVAHRLMKNAIQNNEYLLITEKLLNEVTDATESLQMDWLAASEEYHSIGKIDYRFSLLNDARKNVPDPPAVEDHYPIDQSAYFEKPIAANYMDVYMTVMDIPARPSWMRGMIDAKLEGQDVYIGVIIHCTFENYEAVLSPLRMTITDEGVLYAETCQIDELNLALVHEFVFRKVDEQNSVFGYRLINMKETPIPEDLKTSLNNKLHEMADLLKIHCENATITPVVQRFF
jgi:class 3 adenylate cyclase